MPDKYECQPADFGEPPDYEDDEPPRGRKITANQMNLLASCTTGEQWRSACDLIKASSESGVCYPEDWGEMVLESGLADRVSARWGGSSALTVTTQDNLAGVAKEAMEAVRILAAQCGSAKIRAENMKIIRAYIELTMEKGDSA